MPNVDPGFLFIPRFINMGASLVLVGIYHFWRWHPRIHKPGFIIPGSTLPSFRQRWKSQVAQRRGNDAEMKGQPVTLTAYGPNLGNTPLRKDGSDRF